MAFVRRMMLPVAQRPSMAQIRDEMAAWLAREQAAEEERRREEMQMHLHAAVHAL
jgi:hypothetical protein